MSGEDLRVTTTHLGELTARQIRVAAEIRSATLAFEGVDTAVRNTHGSVAAAVVDALVETISARHGAATAMAAASDRLGHTLAHAANCYDETDDAVGQALEGQVRPA
ncbi:ESX-1 secretion-associated protein [Mycobacterium barrassiae]|uniref:ESX-1 secretion-associated protein n=1 Tax=Mycobacterium barrassiae TaxID=319709 RepID=UPI002265B3C2|nr:ESX-1 secretion-associated protein [Mycobacterium barrassiae]MCV7302137.1 ESX-1 secretion-associated protein [Mycobacterium barrassiae]